MTVQNLDVAQRAGALLPVDWSIVQLRDVLHQRADRVPIQPDGCYTRLGVRWYGGGPFVKDAVQGSEIKSTTLFAAYPKDFIYNRLFAWKGSFGVVGSYGLPVFVSGEFPTFEVDGARMDAEYLWRWFSQPAVWRDIEAQSTGSTQVSRLRFKEDDLLRLSVPCPPVPEQRAIARILRTVERAREATAATIAATAQLRQSLMRHRFTYGPVPVQEAERVAVKDTGIGHAPADWEMRPLGDLCRIVTGSTPPTARADYYDGTIPFVRTSEIVNNVIAHASMFVSEAAVRDCKLRLLPPGTVLLAMYGQGH